MQRFSREFPEAFKEALGEYNRGDAADRKRTTVFSPQADTYSLFGIPARKWMDRLVEDDDHI